MENHSGKPWKEIEEYFDKKLKDVIDTQVIPAVIATQKEVVNGKIDSFRQEQQEVNRLQNDILEKQNKTLDEIRKHTKGTSEILKLYNGGSSFFRGSLTIAKWITGIFAAAIAIWAFIKFVVTSVK